VNTSADNSERQIRFARWDLGVLRRISRAAFSIEKGGL
jgi:hypothetical protein